MGATSTGTTRATSYLTAPGGWVLDISAMLAFADATAYAASVRAMVARTGRTLLVPLPVLAAAALRRGYDAAGRLAGLLADPSVLRGMFAWLGEEFDEETVRATMAVRHSI